MPPLEFGADTELLTMENLCGGELAQDFAAKVREIINIIREAEKGTIAITVELQRTKNTTMVDVSYSIKHTLPAKKRSSICFLDGERNIKTDKQKQTRPKVVGAGMFGAGKGD